MSAPVIARVALPAAVQRLFDYAVAPGQNVQPGSLVRVKFAGRWCDGVAVELADATEVPADKLQALDSVYDLPALPADIRDMAAFIADYYQTDLGMVYALAAPPLDAMNAASRVKKDLALSATGREALAALKEGKHHAPSLWALIDETLASGAISARHQTEISVTQKKYLKEWLRQGWLTKDAPLPPFTASPLQFELNDEQRNAVDAVHGSFGRFQPFLLQGITGSGKTEVYLELARELLAQGKQVLVLVPEIHLTPQFLARVEASLPGVRSAVLHSGLSDGERLTHWIAAAKGEAQFILGTRLSLFTPLPNLGLIVVDEEHDLSFKQMDGVRYSARDMAVWRAAARKIPVVLGSATPSLESYRHALTGRYAHLRLTRRAKAKARLPELSFAPARGDTVREGISQKLWDAIGERLKRHEQSLIFINRRGFSPSLKCAACDWEAACPHCSVRLVLHRNPPKLMCHQCGAVFPVPPACPNCGNVDLLPRGFGTQRLEAALRETFPEARVARVDRDSTRFRRAFDAMRQEVVNNEIDILIGTQMLAKGHDFSRVTLVGVLGADNALYSAEFRATEQLFALLNQVSGRAGRDELAGEVIVQTDFPEHPLYDALKRYAFDEYAKQLLDERRSLALPPFASTAMLAGEARDLEKLKEFMNAARDAGRAIAMAGGAENGDVGVMVYSPIAAAVARKADWHRAQLLIHAGKRSALQAFLRPWRTKLLEMKNRNVRWAIDVDPM